MVCWVVKMIFCRQAGQEVSEVLVPGPEEQLEQQETEEEEEEVEEPGDERREQRGIVSPPLTAATNYRPGVCVCVCVCVCQCVL